MAADDLFWHGFDDEFVVFNQQTGRTHLLHPIGAALLQVLQDAGHSLDIAGLDSAVQQSVGDADFCIPREVLSQALTDLSQLGLTTLESA